VSPGLTGILTVQGSVSLSGTTLIELDPGNSTNDVLSSTAALTFGGTLNLTDISGAPLASGQSYKIFSAPSFPGNFASIVPATPGAGLAWDTTKLKTTGVISVISTTTTKPNLTGVSVTGHTLHITAANGTAGSPVILLGTSNITTPLNLWTHILTNSFDGSGNLNLTTNVVNPAVPQQFYLLAEPQ
jgi:hypothetical protein